MASRPLGVPPTEPLSGSGAVGSSADTLYFTAGLNSEQDGLFGAIKPQ